MPDPDTTSHRSSLRSGIGFASLGFVVSAVLAIVTSVAQARLFGITVVGQFALILAPMGILGLTSSIREQPALIRELAPLSPRVGRVTGLFAAIFTFSSGLTSVLAVPVALGTWLLYTGPLGHPNLWVPALVVLAAYVVLANTAWNLDSIFSAFGDGHALFWVRLNQAVVNLVLIFVLAAVTRSYWAPVLALIASYLTSLVHRLVRVRRWMLLTAGRDDLRYGFQQLPRMLRFGLRMTPGTVASGVMFEAGTWTLAAMSTLSGLAAYNRAWNVSRRAYDVTWRLTEMVFPALARHHAAGDVDALNRTYVSSQRYAVLALAGMAAVVGGAAEPVMRVLFGEDFEDGAGVLAVTMLMPAIGTWLSFQFAYMLVLGRPGATSVVEIGGAIVTVIATIPLTAALGITGPAVGMVLGALTMVAGGTIIVRRVAHVPIRTLWPVRERLALVVCFAASVLAGRLVAATTAGALELFMALATSAAVYAVLIPSLGAANAEDRRRAAAILSRLVGRIRRGTAV